MILGVDLGMGANKIYGPDGGRELPSHVATDGARLVADELAADDDELAGALVDMLF